MFECITYSSTMKACVFKTEAGSYVLSWKYGILSKVNGRYISAKCFIY